MTKTEQIQDALNLVVDDRWGPKTDAAVAEEKAASLARHRPTGAYSARFLKMIPFLWEWEGTKYENDPDDPGGATKYGIDQRSHPDVDIKNLTEARAIAIYWRDYWQKYECEGYDYPMGEVVFNCAVNAGIGRVRNIMAKIGPLSSPNDFLNEQEAFYRNLAKSRPTSAKFLKGWLNRTEALRKHLGIKA